MHRRALWLGLQVFYTPFSSPAMNLPPGYSSRNAGHSQQDPRLLEHTPILGSALVISIFSRRWSDLEVHPIIVLHFPWTPRMSYRAGLIPKANSIYSSYGVVLAILIQPTT